MMKIISDKERLINVNPLVIYFVLDESQCEEYKDNIRLLNNYVGFTRGIFKFEVVAKDDGEHSLLPRDISSEFASSNVFVRLVDSVDGAFRYLFTHIDLSADPDGVEESIIGFVLRACEENVSTLKSLCERLDGNSATCAQVDKAIHIFNKAIAKNRFRRGVWRSPFDEYRDNCVFGFTSSLGFNCDSSGPLEQAMPGFIQSGRMSTKAQRAYDLIKSEFDEDDMQDILTELLGAFGQAPDVETSNHIAKGAVNDRYADNLKQDHYSRFEPHQRPRLKINIKRVSTRSLTTRAYGRVDKKYGVEIEVNDRSASIYFKSRDQTMLYITSLLRHKIGRPLYLYELYNNSFSGAKQTREKLKPWLMSVYNTIYPHANKSFDVWISGVDKNRGRPMHQGKSQLNTTIQSALSEMCEGMYYCVLNTQKDKNGNSYYSLNCSPEDIVLDNEMQQLYDNFKVN